MTKKHFIALADAIREHNRVHPESLRFTAYHLETLSVFCREQNYSFKYGRWTDYIEGKCGPSGGRIKHADL